MPLILLKIARSLWFDAQAENAATFDVGVVGNSRIRALARYGKDGFEVSWQVDPAGVDGDAAQHDRMVTAYESLNLSAFARAAKG